MKLKVQAVVRSISFFAGFLVLHVAWGLENHRHGWVSFSRFTAFFLVVTLTTIALTHVIPLEWTWKQTAKLMAAVLAVESVVLGLLFLSK